MQLEERYYSISELVARGLGSKATIYRLFNSGKLVAIKFGGSTKIAESEILRYIKQNNPPNKNSSKTSS